MKLAYAIALVILPLMTASRQAVHSYRAVNIIRRLKEELIGYPSGHDPSKMAYTIHTRLTIPVVNEHERKLGELQSILDNLRPLPEIFAGLIEEYQLNVPEDIIRTNEDVIESAGAMLGICDHAAMSHKDANMVSRGYFEIFKEGTCGTLGHCIINGEHVPDDDLATDWTDQSVPAQLFVELDSILERCLETYKLVPKLGSMGEYHALDRVQKIRQEIASDIKRKVEKRKLEQKAELLAVIYQEGLNAQIEDI